MALRIVWDKANVDVKVGETKDGLPVYEGKLLSRNEEVPEAPNVSEFQRFILVSIGAAKEDGLASKLVAAAEAREQAVAPAVVLTPEQPPSPAAPAGGLGDFTGGAEQTSGTVQGQTSPENTTPPAPEAGAELPDRPDDRANKPVWEDYAVALGFDRALAESETKAKLIKDADLRRAELEETRKA